MFVPGVGPFVPFGLKSVSRRRARETVCPGVRGKISSREREREERETISTVGNGAPRENSLSLAVVGEKISFDLCCLFLGWLCKQWGTDDDVTRRDETKRNATRRARRAQTQRDRERENNGLAVRAIFVCVRFDGTWALATCLRRGTGSALLPRESRLTIVLLHEVGGPRSAGHSALKKYSSVSCSRANLPLGSDLSSLFHLLLAAGETPR